MVGHVDMGVVLVATVQLHKQYTFPIICIVFISYFHSLYGNTAIAGTGTHGRAHPTTERMKRGGSNTFIASIQKSFHISRERTEILEF